MYNAYTTGTHCRLDVHSPFCSFSVSLPTRMSTLGRPRPVSIEHRSPHSMSQLNALPGTDGADVRALDQHLVLSLTHPKAYAAAGTRAQT